MMADILSSAETAFRAYTDPYRRYGDKIILKIEHSHRVRQLSENIAASLGPQCAEVELSAVCGLLHDIGRFEQWKEYGTYNDGRSVDHGDLGAEILGADGFLDFLCPADRAALLKVVRVHNKYDLPSDMTDRECRLAKVIRDADKIDVFRLYTDRSSAKLSKGSAFSLHIFQAMLAENPIRGSEIRTKADEIAVSLAFVFDLNYRRSFEIMDSSGYIDRLIAIQTEEASNSELKKQLTEAGKCINRYIERRLLNAE